MSEDDHPSHHFRKSHTCGSLYANCACPSTKRLSNPEIKTRTEAEPQIRAHPNGRSLRLQGRTLSLQDGPRHESQPDLRTEGAEPPHFLYDWSRADATGHAHDPWAARDWPRRSSREGRTVNVYLEHPEINFPIPVEVATDDEAKHAPDSKPRLHKYGSHESQHRAQKFLQDFGIIPPCCSPPPAEATPLGQPLAPPLGVEGRGRRRSSKFFEELEQLRAEVEKLRREKEEWGRRMRDKEGEVTRLRREVHKLKSVLQQTTPIFPSSASSASTLSKKQGVSGESGHEGDDAAVPKFEKDFRSKQLIKSAISDNAFLRHLDIAQIREMVEAMRPLEVAGGSDLIREGEAGAHLFVSGEGAEFEVWRRGREDEPIGYEGAQRQGGGGADPGRTNGKEERAFLGTMGGGKAFGELAVLYNCTRTATVTAIKDCQVWILDRKIFQRIMMKTGKQRLEDNINFLKSVPLLQNMNSEILAKIADVLEVEFYPADTYIIRQGASGDTFFIISSGSVKVTQRLPGHLEEETELRLLRRGDYFGEQALIREDVRTASCIATPPGVECLTLDRESFLQLIGETTAIRGRAYDEIGAGRTTASTNETTAEEGGAIQEEEDYSDVSLDGLRGVATLGVGGFARVDLVSCARAEGGVATFALKRLRKRHVVDTEQQEHTYAERDVMMTCRSQFVCRLYKTFKDSKHVYMLLEACLGGEVWTILRDRGCFDEYTTRFITACVIEAFDYLHSRGIIYRDLKPENLLLDSRGYAKLVDFGFTKRLQSPTSKTWTFCGTPEYVAPETILNKGHDRAVDYWALGILVHELLNGSPPFTALEPMQTYNLILKGIDTLDLERFEMSKVARNLIRKLCRDAPSERLGCHRGGAQDVRKHKWYQGFDWDSLRNGTLPSPVKRDVSGPLDVSNFDRFDGTGENEENVQEEFSGWDKDF